MSIAAPPTTEPDLTAYLESVHAQVAANTDGALADYIPSLAEADPDGFGIAVCTTTGELYEAGDAREEFSIQSVSKPFTYALALQEVGFDAVDAAIDVEPSGEAYNKISLGAETGRPANALINAGAIAATSLLAHRGRVARLLDFYGTLAGRRLRADAAIAMQEVEEGHRNLALAHLMRSFDVLGDDPVEATRDYCAACATLVTAVDLAQMAATLANFGVQPVSGERVVQPTVVQRVLSVMTMCGMYDDAGWWMCQVGVPGKSGVGGGLLAVAPGRLGLAVYSPRLDEHGSSVRGLEVCERISHDLDLHMMSNRGVRGV